MFFPDLKSDGFIIENCQFNVKQFKYRKFTIVNPGGEVKQNDYFKIFYWKILQSKMNIRQSEFIFEFQAIFTKQLEPIC